MDKQNAVYAYMGILFSLKSERNSGKFYDMPEPWDYNARWNKPVTKDKYYMSPFTWGI